MIYVLCSRCDIDQPRDQFGPSADQWPRHRQCKKCSRRLAQMRKHGIDASQKAEIAAAQGGCLICGHPEPSEKGWVLDHDRACCAGDKSCPKCRRGVICQWCNTMLGNAFDRPGSLRAGADYLERPRDCSWHMPVACAPSICSGDARADATDVTDKDVLTKIQSPPAESFRCATPTGGQSETIISAAVIARNVLVGASA